MAKSAKTKTHIDKIEKFTIYLPSELANKISSLAHFNQCTVTELFSRISQDYADKNKRALELFNEAIEKAKSEIEA